ncbi:hypothetical protein HPB48_023327 [Haemaphysalis longicornis]|uniref:Reverse transcriptase domain-containing protein n=1 Tax=Haemaphysalis longicornis TaxID=44386 RepID=A0A9J6H798_HAELO|nr:hypothetical protein HPB48_023327 [Haemaphysalis longicornis]
MQVVHGTCDTEITVMYTMSIDVQDFFYTIPHYELMKSVKLYITEYNREVGFIQKYGLSVNSFIEILEFYRKSIFIEWQNEVQKRGMCIGGKVALISNIFLGTVHGTMERNLCGLAKQIFRYIDYFLIIPENGELNEEGLLNLFSDCGLDLQFKYKLPELNELQFLNL